MVRKDVNLSGGLSMLQTSLRISLSLVILLQGETLANGLSDREYSVIDSPKISTALLFPGNAEFVCPECFVSSRKSKWNWLGHMKLHHPDVYDQLREDRLRSHTVLTEAMENIEDEVI